MKKDLTKMADLSQAEIFSLLDLAAKLKYERHHGIAHPILAGQSLGMIFQKSSTRTRVSFETGIYQLGGSRSFSPRGTCRSDAANPLSIRRVCCPGISMGS